MNFSRFCDDYLHQREYVIKFLLENDRPLAKKAIEFAEERHEGQKRLDESPYVVHLIEVAYYHIIFELDDDVTLATCFLHDGPEEGKMTHEEIFKNFGKEIAHRVYGVTKDNSLSSEELENHFDLIFEKIEMIFLKIIDRFTNVKRSMIGFFAKEKLEKYCDETDMLISRLEGFIAILEKEKENPYHEYARTLRILRGFLKGFIQAAREHLKIMKDEKIQ